MLPRITILTGVVLIMLGLAGYFGTRRESITAMIPAFVGLPLRGLGLLALKPAARGGIARHHPRRTRRRSA